MSARYFFILVYDIHAFVIKVVAFYASNIDWFIALLTAKTAKKFKRKNDIK